MRARPRSAGPLAVALGLALAAACARAPGEGDDGDVGTDRQDARPLDRFLLGQAAPYPADRTLRDKAPLLEADMRERRRAAWAIVERVVAPVPVAATPASGEAVAVPRFHTWYSREDFLPMFDHLFRGLSDADKLARAPFGRAQIAAAFPWNARGSGALENVTRERYEERRREIAAPEGAHSLGGDGRALMSPGYVAHLLRNYGSIVDCEAPAPSSGGAFAPCLDAEFPPEAVAVKTRWMPVTTPVPTFDTSAAGLAAKLARGTFGPGDGQADPGPDAIYTMRAAPGVAMRLTALHVMTKELRDWAWVTLFWSDEPDADFGADRPASLAGPFAHYKMCVTTAFGEGDPDPAGGFGPHPTLAAALAAAAAHGPSTWCSNPYLETGERAAKTNCVGCHQHGGTDETSATVLADPVAFPDHGRTKVRNNFPVDYAFTTHGGLDLAAEMRARIEELTPAP